MALIFSNDLLSFLIDMEIPIFIYNVVSHSASTVFPDTLITLWKSLFLDFERFVVCCLLCLFHIFWAFSL